MSRHNKQAGSVLIVYMILMMLMSMVAVSAFDTAVTEQRMAGNAQFQMKAFNDAEASLVQAENFIRDNISVTFADYKKQQGLVGNIINQVNNVTIEYLQSTVVIETTEPYSGPDPGCGENQTGCLDYYQITSTGKGVGSAVQVVQTIFGNYIPYVP